MHPTTPAALSVITGITGISQTLQLYPRNSTLFAGHAGPHETTIVAPGFVPLRRAFLGTTKAFQQEFSARAYVTATHHTQPYPRAPLWATRPLRCPTGRVALLQALAPQTPTPPHSHALVRGRRGRRKEPGCANGWRSWSARLVDAR